MQARRSGLGGDFSILMIECFIIYGITEADIVALSIGRERRARGRKAVRQVERESEREIEREGERGRGREIGRWRGRGRERESER